MNELVFLLEIMLESLLIRRMKNMEKRNRIDDQDMFFGHDCDRSIWVPRPSLGLSGGPKLAQINL